MTSKEFLKRLKNILSEYHILYNKNRKAMELEEDFTYLNRIIDDLERLEKQDKILKILKTKRIDIYYLSTCLYEDEEEGYEDYNGYDSEDDLTVEEFKLLKEWLDGSINQR